MKKSTTVAFAGHRPKELWGYTDEKDNNYEKLQNYLYENIIPQLYTEGYRTFLTSGEQGFQSCVFWAVAQFKLMHPDVENIIFSPCPSQEKFWSEAGRFGKSRYRQALDLADEFRDITETYLPTSMQLCHQAMVNNANILVSLCNDTPEDKKSHTYQTIKMADKKENYRIATIHYNLDNASFAYTERLSKGLTETRKVKLGDRNLIGVENTNPVPPLPIDGFGDVICFDTETTGFDYAKYDELLQIAIVGSNGAEWMTYIKPERNEIWRKTEKIHHIYPSTVKDAPSSFAVMQALYPFFKAAKLVVGHNVTFDLNFLEAAGLQVSTEVWDTCVYFRKDIPKGSHKLAKAVEEYAPDFLEEYTLGAHDALTDTRATMRVYMAQEAKEKEKQIASDTQNKDEIQEIRQSASNHLER